MTAALAFRQVSKRFTIQHERPESFQDRFVQAFRRRSTSEEFWVLRDISFSVSDGETFGVIGRNGAGKSTLLKLATGILKPTTGEIQRHRRVYAMLELGAGFHPELSGRDNIYLNGSIHGLNRAGMHKLFDRIVEFAELERFIDTPVKHYSSGMFMRLGFAAAIHMQPELLIIDEILAVGDAAFRRKCTEALWSLKRQGVTIMFVSHNEEAVYQFCDRALLLVDGAIAAFGPVEDVITSYVSTMEADQEAATARTEQRPLIRSVTILDEHGAEAESLIPGDPWSVEITTHLPDDAVLISGEVMLYTETGAPFVGATLDDQPVTGCAGLNTIRLYFAPLPQPVYAGRLRASVRLLITAKDGIIHNASHDSTHSVTVGGRGHGPLLSLPHTWELAPRASAPSKIPAIAGDDDYA